MNIIIETDIQPELDEIFEYRKLSNKRSYGGSYFSFYFVSVIMLMLAVADILIPASQINWLFAAVSLTASLFFFLQPPLFIPLSIKSSINNKYKNTNPSLHHIILTDERIIETPVKDKKPPFTEINIPLNQLSAVYETDEMFVYFIDTNRAILLPKRLITPEICDTVREISGSTRIK